MARKKKKEEPVVATPEVEEVKDESSAVIDEMEDTIRMLETKLEKLSKQKEDELKEVLDSVKKEFKENDAPVRDSIIDSLDKDDTSTISGGDDNTTEDISASSASTSRIIDKDDNPLSNQTYEIDPEEKQEYLIQIYLLYPITSGEIMVQIDSFLNIYQVQENRKLIQECESKIMKTNEPQPLQISVTTKEDPYKEKTITFSKVIGIAHSLPMITSITTM